MPDPIPLSTLRQDIYRLVDAVLESGEPLEIARKGRTLRIVPDVPTNRLARITPMRGLVVGDPGELVGLDWSDSWDPAANA